MKWVFVHVKGTSEVGLLYFNHEGSDVGVTSFVDLDCTGCLDTRRYLTRYFFKLYDNTVG